MRTLVHLEIHRLFHLWVVYSVSQPSQLSDYLLLITAWLSFSSAGILLAFLFPRVPQFSINQDTPLSAATGDWNNSIPIKFLTFPANFSFPAFAELEVDTGSNFIPLKFTHLNAQIFDLQTSAQVGNGDMYGVTFPPKVFTKLQVPMNFSYTADNSSDITCKSCFPHLLPLLCAVGLTPWSSQGRAGTTPAEIRDNSPTGKGRVRSFSRLSRKTGLIF